MPRSSKRNLMLVFLTSILSATALGAEGWSSYHNMRFGTTADVPQGWHSGPRPANDDGLTFTSPDGTAQLTISGMLNVSEGLDSASKDFATPEESEKITYIHRGANSLTVSGTRGDRIFYANHLLSCRNQVWNDIYLEYPATQKAQYDPIVAHVAKSLREGKGYQIKDCGG